MEEQEDQEVPNIKLQKCIYLKIIWLDFSIFSATDNM